MDNSMIREALQRIANDLSPNNLPIDAVMEGHHGLTVRRIADRCFNDAIQALAELDKPGEADVLKSANDARISSEQGTGKALTEEKVKRIAEDLEDILCENDGVVRSSSWLYRDGAKDALRYARDHGYLAPVKAPGEVVEAGNAMREYLGDLSRAAQQRPKEMQHLFDRWDAALKPNTPEHGN